MRPGGAAEADTGREGQGAAGGGLARVGDAQQPAAAVGGGHTFHQGVEDALASEEGPRVGGSVRDDNKHARSHILLARDLDGKDLDGEAAGRRVGLEFLGGVPAWLASIGAAKAQHLAVEQAVGADGVAPARGDACAELAEGVDGELPISIEGGLSCVEGLLGQWGELCQELLMTVVGQHWGLGAKRG